MAVFTFKPNSAFDTTMDMIEARADFVDTMFESEREIFSSSAVTFYYDDATMTLGGRGLRYLISGSEFDDVTAGTVTSLRVNTPNGAPVISLTGANVDAVRLFDLAEANRPVEMFNLFFVGNDQISGGAYNDRLFGHTGNDLVSGAGGNDRLWGDAGNDRVVGGTGADTLYGGIGADTLVGGAGNDVLFGSIGADAFAFAEFGAANADRIADFNAVNDVIRLDIDVFTGFRATGQMRLADFRLGTTAVDASDRIIYQQSTGNLWYDADGTGSRGKVLIADLADGTTLTSADIFVV